MNGGESKKERKGHDCSWVWWGEIIVEGRTSGRVQSGPDQTALGQGGREGIDTAARRQKVQTGAGN